MKTARTAKERPMKRRWLVWLAMLPVWALAQGGGPGWDGQPSKRWVREEIARATNGVTANEVGAYTYNQANASNAADRAYTDGATNAITLQEVVTRGGTVTSGTVTIDAANARTNTFGGYLTVLGMRIGSGVGGTVSDYSISGGFSTDVASYSMGWGTSGTIGNYSIGGGDHTTVGDYSFGGGSLNWLGNYSIGGGNGVTVGNYSIGGGRSVDVGNYSFGAGRRAKGATGSFIFADSHDADFDRTAYTNDFAVRVDSIYLDIGATIVDGIETNLTGSANKLPTSQAVMAGIAATGTAVRVYCSNAANLTGNAPKAVITNALSQSVGGSIVYSNATGKIYSTASGGSSTPPATNTTTIRMTGGGAPVAFPNGISIAGTAITNVTTSSVIGFAANVTNQAAVSVNGSGWVYVALPFQRELYDTSNLWNPATSTFTPNTSGVWEVSASAFFAGGSVPGNAYLYLMNGSTEVIQLAASGGTTERKLSGISQEYLYAGSNYTICVTWASGGAKNMEFYRTVHAVTGRFVR
jgi:hypothetical protein